MDGQIKLLFLFISIYLCIEVKYAKQYYELVPQPTVCRVLAADIVYNYTCATKMVNRTTHSMTRELNFQLGVALHNFHVNLQLNRKYGTQFPFMFKLDQDMCAFLGGNHTRENTLLMRFLNTNARRKYGNFYDPCPLSGRRFELDFRSDYSSLPDIFPAAEYRFDMTSYTFVNGVKTNVMITQSFAEVRSKTCKKNSIKKCYLKDQNT